MTQTHRAAYGSGARTYGGPVVRGREQQKQMIEESDGIRPTADYQMTNWRPELWKDLDKDGYPVVGEAGHFFGLASIDSGAVITGAEANAAALAAKSVISDVIENGLVAANSGIRQRLLYKSDDVGLVSDLQNYPTLVAAAGPTVKFEAGNKPLGLASTNLYSESIPAKFVNFRVQHKVPLLTDWYILLPISDPFAFGGIVNVTTSGDGLVETFLLNTFTLTGFTGRASSGYAPVATSGAVTLKGVHTGDLVMANPYLPGKLISVDDFVRMAMADTKQESVFGLSLANQINIAAGLGPVAMTYERAMAYAMQHVLGRCYRRVRVAENKSTAGVTTLSNQDIYASALARVKTAPGMGLSGQDSEGIESHVSSARQFSDIVAKSNAGVAKGVDVMYINLHVA